MYVQRTYSHNDATARAFTLVELLVVIAIISLLAALLMPSLNKAKEFARLSVCGANMRSFGVSLAIYATDFNGYYPHNGSPIKANWAANLVNTGALPEGTWDRNLTSARGLLLCPSTQPPAFDTTHTWLCSYGPTLSSEAGCEVDDAEQAEANSKKTRGGMLLSFNSSLRYRPKPSKLVLPGSVLLIEKALSASSTTAWNYDPPFATSYDWNVPNYTNLYWSPQSLYHLWSTDYRHADRANFLYDDMHVGSFAASMQFSGDWVNN